MTTPSCANPPGVVNLAGHDLSFVDTGQGSAILFIHGLLGSHANWTHLVDRLDTDHRVVIPDLFGHAPPRSRSVTTRSARTPRSCATSSTGSASTASRSSATPSVADRHAVLLPVPRAVEALVLVSTGGLGRTVSPLLRSATLPGAELVPPVIASSWVRERVETVGRAVRGLGWPRAPTRRRPGRASPLSRTPRADARSWPRRAASSTPRRQTVNARGRLTAGEPIRTLVIWGTRDRMIPVGHAERAHEVFPRRRGRALRGRRPLPAPRAARPLRERPRGLHPRLGREGSPVMTTSEWPRRVEGG